MNIQGNDFYLHHIPTKNHSYTKPKDIYGPEHIRKTNSNGWWDNREFDLLEIKKKRIFILGDSQVYGYLRNENEDPFIYLENILNYEEKNYEVINVGLTSYSTLIHLLNIKKNLIQYGPKSVVIYFDLNTDFLNDRYYDLISLKDDKGEVYAIPPINSDNYFQVDNSIYRVPSTHKLFKSILNLKFIKLLGLRLNIFEEVNIKNNYVYDQEFITINIFEKIYKLLDKNGIEFLLVNIPHLKFFTDKENEEHYKQILEFVDKNKINFIDGVKIAEEIDVEKLSLYTKDEFHINPYFHQLIADQLYYKIKK